MVCPELTEQIRREVAASLHQRKGDFTCYFLTDLVTFTLPAGQPPHCQLTQQGRVSALAQNNFNSQALETELQNLSQCTFWVFV